MVLIGKGILSRAYRDGDIVYIYTRDKTKLCLAEHPIKSVNFPLLEKIGESSDTGEYIFRTEFYPRIKTLSGLKPDQYELYKKLESAYVNYMSFITKDNITPRKANLMTHEILYNSLQINKKFRRDLFTHLDNLKKYGRDPLLDIKIRNVSEKEGNLILLDCFIFLRQIERALEMSN